MQAGGQGFESPHLHFPLHLRASRVQKASPQYCAKETIPHSMRNILHSAVEVPVMARLLRIPSKQKILLVGCGSGVALPPLAKLLAPRTTTGIDVDRDLLCEAAKWMRDNAVRGVLVQADVRAMPFPDRSFDVVVDFGTCYQIANPQLALKEIARVLDDGGVFIHETPLAQLLAHPFNYAGQLPWNEEPSLGSGPSAGFWAIKKKH